MASLKATVGKEQPIYTEATIKIAMRSEVGSSNVWIVVEGDDDIEVYEKFFNKEKTKVMSSANEEGNKGCEYLEVIVTNILKDNPEALIFGIRDSDYTRYENIVHKFPKSVFTTDYRDIEMMMLSAPSVIKELTKWNPTLTDAMEYCIPVARHIGYIRVCNHVHNLGFNFKTTIKKSLFWNSETDTLFQDWEERISTKFSEHCQCNFPDIDLQKFIHNKKLNEEQHWYICQGHDLMRMLQYRLPKTDQIHSRVRNAYSIEDFSHTKLYSTISEWATTHAVDIYEPFTPNID